MFLAKVIVNLRPTVNDPQGQTIHSGLEQLGFSTVKNVRAGKYMEIYLDESSEESAGYRVTEMCNKLLANSVIEDFSFELECWTSLEDCPKDS